MIGLMVVVMFVPVQVHNIKAWFWSNNFLKWELSWLFKSIKEYLSIYKSIKFTQLATMLPEVVICFKDFCQKYPYSKVSQFPKFPNFLIYDFGVSIGVKWCFSVNSNILTYLQYVPKLFHNNTCSFMQIIIK